MTERAIEAAHRKAVEAAEASSRASGGQPYDGHPAPAYEVYRDALFAALADDDAAVERVARAIWYDKEPDTRVWEDKHEIMKDEWRRTARAAIRALGE